MLTYFGQFQDFLVLQVSITYCDFHSGRCGSTATNCAHKSNNWIFVDHFVRYFGAGECGFAVGRLEGIIALAVIQWYQWSPAPTNITHVPPFNWRLTPFFGSKTVGGWRPRGRLWREKKISSHPPNTHTHVHTDTDAKIPFQIPDGVFGICFLFFMTKKRQLPRNTHSAYLGTDLYNRQCVHGKMSIKWDMTAKTL